MMRRARSSGVNTGPGGVTGESFGQIFEGEKGGSETAKL